MKVINLFFLTILQSLLYYLLYLSDKLIAKQLMMLSILLMIHQPYITGLYPCSIISVQSVYQRQQKHQQKYYYSIISVLFIFLLQKIIKILLGKYYLQSLILLLLYFLYSLLCYCSVKPIQIIQNLQQKHQQKYNYSNLSVRSIIFLLTIHELLQALPNLKLLNNFLIKFLQYLIQKDLYNWITN